MADLMHGLTSKSEHSAPLTPGDSFTKNDANEKKGENGFKNRD